MKLRSTVIACLLLLSGMTVQAGDDPSIEGELRINIQKTMQAYIDNHIVDGIYWHYDGATGTLLELEFEKLHAGIVKKGPFYVSCADFSAPDGQTLDMDFLVVRGANGLTAVQGFVHKMDGKKRQYDFETE